MDDSGSAGSSGDLDGDGWTNYQEYLSCTAPDDAASVPAAPTTPPGGSPADGGQTATPTPLLAVVHATDADLDSLSYFFEIDTVDTFDSFELEQSAELAQQAGDSTNWATLELGDNTTYYWRVRADDGQLAGSWMPTVVLAVNSAGVDMEYEIQTRRQVSAGSIKQQAVNVASANSPIYKTAVEIPPGALRQDCTINIGAVTNPPALPAPPHPESRARHRIRAFGHDV